MAFQIHKNITLKNKKKIDVKITKLLKSYNLRSLEDKKNKRHAT